MSSLYRRAAAFDGDYDTSAVPTDVGVVRVTSSPVVVTNQPRGHDVSSSLRRLVGLLSKDEVAAALQVSGATLALWRSKRRGPPFVRLGTRVFYLVNEFEGWVEQEFREQSQNNQTKKQRRSNSPHKHRKQKQDDIVGNVISPAVPVTDSRPGAVYPVTQTIAPPPTT